MAGWLYGWAYRCGCLDVNIYIYLINKDCQINKLAPIRTLVTLRQTDRHTHTYADREIESGICLEMEIDREKERGRERGRYSQCVKMIIK